MDHPPTRSRELHELALELGQLAKHAPARLAERVAALSVREQAELALRLPAKERLELLLHAPRPMRLVRSLPDFELYMTVRELGPIDALPLVALASAAQLQHLIDLESWRGDRFDASRAGAWVALLLEAGEPTLKRFLRTADEDLLSLIFQRWVRVRQIEPEEEDRGVHGFGYTEAGHEHGLVSPDGYYLFAPIIAEHAPAVQRIARLFYCDQPALYQKVLWRAVMQLPAELEEQELRWRQSRLEEHGFPPWDEAISVYAPPAGINSHPDPLEPTDPDGLPAPRIPLRLLASDHPLADALDYLHGEQRERLLHEFLALGNHLMVADGSDTGDPNAHRTTLLNGAGYVAVALDARGSRELSRSRRVFTEVPLIELFREGYAQAVELQKGATDLARNGWAAAHPQALELLDVPIRERVRGLLEPRPLYFEIGGEGRPGAYRPFRSLREIEETRVALEIAALIGRVMVDRLGLDIDRLMSDREIAASEAPRFSTMLLTLLGWHAARGELRGDPLPGDVVSDFLRNVASRRTAAPDAGERAFEALLRAMAPAFGLTARDLGLLRGFGRACLERLASECSSLDPGVPVDPRFVSCLLLRV